jgi:hypothetical protein
MTLYHTSAECRRYGTMFQVYMPEEAQLSMAELVNARSTHDQHQYTVYTCRSQELACLSCTAAAQLR